MKFKEYVDALAKDLGIEIETENDAGAVSLETDADDRLTILLHGFDERGAPPSSPPAKKPGTWRTPSTGTTTRSA